MPSRKEARRTWSIRWRLAPRLWPLLHFCLQVPWTKPCQMGAPSGRPGPTSFRTLTHPFIPHPSARWVYRPLRCNDVTYGFLGEKFGIRGSATATGTPEESGRSSPEVVLQNRVKTSSPSESAPESPVAAELQALPYRFETRRPSQAFL